MGQYDFLSRSKTEQDAYLYALQQQGRTEDQVAEAKAPIAELLTAMNDEIVACYDQFITMPQPVQYLSQVCYSSVPGWCCNAGCFVPTWYYDNGCFVGPVFDAACSGLLAQPVYRAYFDAGSQFYSTYHSVTMRVHVNRSINLAHRQADWFRHHGDWRSAMAHDRLLHRSPTAGYASATRLPAAAGNPIDKHASPNHSPRAAAVQGSRNFARVGSRKPVARQRKSQFSRGLASRPPKPRQQGAKPRAPACGAGKGCRARQQSLMRSVPRLPMPMRPIRQRMPQDRRTRIASKTRADPQSHAGYAKRQGHR